MMLPEETTSRGFEGGRRPHCLWWKEC